MITMNGHPISDARRGRPPKPSLTDEEYAKVCQVLAKGPFKHGSSLDAAADAISTMRGRDSVITPAAKKFRTVSGRWISRELTKRGKTRTMAKMEADPLRQQARQIAEPRAIQDPDSHQVAGKTAEIAGVNRREAAQPVGFDQVAAGRGSA